MSEDIISKAVDFMLAVKQGNYVLLKFTKKDGSTRIMKATLNFEHIPKEKIPKDINLDKIMKLLEEKKILRVYDLEKLDWRTIPFEQVEWLQTFDKEHKVKRFKIDTKKILKF